MFLALEVAAVGLNEQQARRRQAPYRFAVVQNRLLGRSLHEASIFGPDLLRCCSG